MDLKKIIREELITKLKPMGVGTRKAALGLILDNVPSSPRLNITEEAVVFKMIASADGYGRKSHDALTFNIGDIHNPKTDITKVASRVAKAIGKFLEFCEMSDDFVLEPPELVGSTKIAALRKIIKSQLPEFFKKYSAGGDINAAISNNLQSIKVFDNSKVQNTLGVDISPEDFAKDIKIKVQKSIKEFEEQEAYYKSLKGQ